MTHPVILREPRTLTSGDILLGICGFLLTLTACVGSPKTPDWVSGAKSIAYPDHQFLIGVGQGESRAVAEERAYAAVSRIFKADVTSQAKDWESYLHLERNGSRHMERRLNIETMTKVTTDKFLENTTIADTWKDPTTNLYSALAVLERRPASAVLAKRVGELDEVIDRDIKESGGGGDKLLTLRKRHRAVKNLIIREMLNSDIRVLSGLGIPSEFSVSALTRDLEQFLHDNLVVAVEVKGDQADVVRQAIIETLLRQGLPVTARVSGEGAVADLIVTGETRLWPAGLPDPKFRYVRWCGDFTLISPQAERILGTVARSGREGHLNYREASNRALIALQQEVGAALVQSLRDQLYGESAPELAQSPAACPRLSGS
jgi:LPP20 lipoprotein